MASIAKKAGLKQTEFFGIQCPRVMMRGDSQTAVDPKTTEDLPESGTPPLFLARF